MRAGRLGALLAGLLALGTVLMLTGCGGGGGSTVPSVAQLPLVPGSSIVAQARQCDRGAAAYCTVEVVVVSRRYKTSDDLLADERSHLVSLGWSRESAEIGNEHAADSPGNKLRVTYATAINDLTGIQLNWITRSRTISLALSHALFQRVPALSMMLEFSSG